MAQLALLCPSDDELCDAQDALAHLLDLNELGEIDLPPYLQRLLLQVQEILAAATPQATRRPDRTQLVAP